MSSLFANSLPEVCLAVIQDKPQHRSPQVGSDLYWLYLWGDV